MQQPSMCCLTDAATQSLGFFGLISRGHPAAVPKAQILEWNRGSCGAWGVVGELSSGCLGGAALQLQLVPASLGA